MARLKYFSDYNGQTVELALQDSMDNDQFAKAFPGVRGIRYDGYCKRVGREKSGSDLLPVTRIIEYKSQPSLHNCNSRCQGAKPQGVCECKCGGKNHGVGLFTRLHEQVQEALAI